MIFRFYYSMNFLCYFLVTLFRNYSKYYIFSLLFLMILGVRCEVFWKESKYESFCMADISVDFKKEAIRSGKYGFSEQPTAFKK